MNEQEESAPLGVKLTNGLGRAPARATVEKLMKRCQIGVGGRRALDDAHDILADCYGTLGLLMQCLEASQAEVIKQRVALVGIKHRAASLADAQVIALEALRA